MIKFNLRQKVLLAFVALAFIPLAMLAFYSAKNLNQVESYLKQSATAAFDTDAAKSLVFRAQTVAGEVSSFLESIVQDLHDLSLMPPSEKTYIDFYKRHKKTIWYMDGDKEIFKKLPIYKEIAFVSPDGTEKIRIVSGKKSSELRDVSRPENTTYLKEDYFNKAISEGIHVSRVTGWHTNKSAEESYYGTKYQGVVRFSKAVISEGELKGVLVLSLDHHHLMEYTQHITPTDRKFIVSPSYQSGNYAFMFDDEGWIITHPKHWDIRGLDKNGNLLRPYSENSSESDIDSGNIPYNLKHAGFIHKNYPVVASEVLMKSSGVVDVTNVGGAEKIMAYAPVRFETGEYKYSGVFGGITIGAEVSQFHQQAENISGVIKSEIAKFVKRTWIMIGATLLIVLIVSYRLAHSVTNPINKLLIGTRQMAAGNMGTIVEVENNDEVGKLAESFNSMSVQLEARQNELYKSMEMLKNSREEIIKEQNFKNTVFENIETGVITIDIDNTITFINSPAKNILKIPDRKTGQNLLKAMSGWENLQQEFNKILKFDPEQKWSQYIEEEKAGRLITFRVTILPLHVGSSDGRIITIEDLTERVNMRSQMNRMERLASMGRLSAGLAHEIRNPLTGINIMLDDLHDRLLGNQNDQVLIQKSLQEIERIEGLVNELLSFARTTSAQMEKGNIGNILKDILLLMSKQCQKRGIEIEKHIAIDLIEFPIDSLKIKQAFLNLINNAIEAMPEGGRLIVKAYNEANKVKVIIKDTGEGISKEQIQYLFEPFYTTKGEGTGLGLAITHNIVSDHNAKIDVQSNIGEGTEFIVTFPSST